MVSIYNLKGQASVIGNERASIGNLKGQARAVENGKGIHWQFKGTGSRC